MKKLLSVLLFAVLFSLSVVIVYADSGNKGENLTWTLENGILTISGTGAMDNYSYDNISPSYSGVRDITTIVIKPGVTTIGDYAFYDCTSLTSITIPDSVTSIGWQAFAGCTSLASITIPNSVTTIGDSAFAYCNSLTSITIPDSVTNIGEQAFYGCNSITRVTIPNGVNRIGNGAFSSCASLISITIPESVTTISDNVFSSCSSLVNITIPNSVTTIDDSAFAGCSSLKNIIIPNSVTTIGDSAFAYCNSLTSITIPDSVVAIDAFAFAYCVSLTSIAIPDSVTTIGDGAFYGCSSLANITIPDGITTIGVGAFFACSSLESITIPNSVTTICDTAFSSCNSLTSITIPNSVTIIDDGAFYGCSSLISLTVSDSITTIGDSVFASCDYLTIYGKNGSYVEVYAKENEIPFVAINTVLLNFKKTNIFNENQFKDAQTSDWYYNNVKTAYEYSLMMGTSFNSFAPNDNLTLAQVITLAARLHSTYETGKEEFLQGSVWYQVYVDYCIANGIINANEYKDYNKNATRAEFVAILSRSIPSNEFNTINSFTSIVDVSPSHNSYKEILNFYNAGIIVGSDEKYSFNPGNNITRAETAAIITRIVDKNLRVKI